MIAQKNEGDHDACDTTAVTIEGASVQFAERGDGPKPRLVGQLRADERLENPLGALGQGCGGNRARGVRERGEQRPLMSRCPRESASDARESSSSHACGGR